MDIKKEYERWLMNATADADVAAELKTLDDTKIEDRCLNYWRNSKYSARNMFLFYKMDRMYFSIMYYNWCLNRNMGFIWCKKI